MRKFGKLFRTPKKFFQDFFLKRSLKILPFGLFSLSLREKYSVVTAIYNSDKYLDSYFKSIVNQTVGFKKNIQLICVDDGSTDNSVEIARKWQKKYPKNITLLLCEHAGQSAARNHGLNYARNDWITFIDSDDFIHYDFFRVVNNVSKYNADIKMIVTNIIFYKEKMRSYSDSHPLRFKFHENVSLRFIDGLDEYINLSVASSFFRMSHIRKSGVSFDELVRPSFEDGKFILDYLRHQKGRVAYIKKAKYYYRKRGDESSTLDGSWSREEKYCDVIKHGYLSVLKIDEDPPLYVIYTILYEINNYINFLKNRDDRICFLSSDRRRNFIDSLKEISKHIEARNVVDFKRMSSINKMIFLSILKGLSGFCEIYGQNRFSKISYFCSNENDFNVLQRFVKKRGAAYVEESKFNFLGHTLYVLEAELLEDGSKHIEEISSLSEFWNFYHPDQFINNFT